MTVKNPIFMESVRVNQNDEVDVNLIKNTIKDFENQIVNSVIGERKGFFRNDTEEFVSLGECFNTIRTWIKEIYEV